jgi:hypothetical protein
MPVKIVAGILKMSLFSNAQECLVLKAFLRFTIVYNQTDIKLFSKGLQGRAKKGNFRRFFQNITPDDNLMLKF